MHLEAIDDLPTELRSGYLRSLVASQEFFLENAVQHAEKVLVREGDEAIGYAASQGGTLMEFFMAKAWRGSRDEAFALVCEERRVRSVLCKSFDALTVAVAALRPARVETVAWLFRSFQPPSAAERTGLGCRVAGMDAVDDVLTIHDGFFEDREEIERYVRTGGLFLFETEDAELVGCGITARIIEDGPWVDVGMVVAPAHRQRGIGARIVAELASRCLAAGDEPVCGCEIGNVASRRTLERAGFRTDHSLIRFSYDVSLDPEA